LFSSSDDAHGQVAVDEVPDGQLGDARLVVRWSPEQAVELLEG
jgi:hypothetical protein